MKSFLGRLEFALEREVVVRAPRTLVFRYFTDGERWARWWGAGSTVDGRAGGALSIVLPGGTTVTGEILELRAPERVVFTYGYEAGAGPIPPGGSRVTITLRDDPQGTRVHLLHELADRTARDQHVQGWRYQLALFANVAANEAHASLGDLADRWFAAWNEPDPAARHGAFASLLAEGFLFHDAYSCTRGLDDLDAHVTAAKTQMPGLTLARVGQPRHCQGTALVDWVANGPDGQPLAKGTNVLELAPDGRLARVVGLWG